MPSLYELYMSKFPGSSDEWSKFRQAAQAQFANNSAFDWLKSQPYVWRARRNYNARALDAALANYDKAIAIFENSWSRIGRGDTLLALRRMDDARKDYLRALEINPNRDAAYFGLARVSIVERQTEKAIAYLDKAIAQDPYDPDKLIRRVRNLITLGQFDLASQDLKRAMVYAPYDDDVHFYVGYIHRMNKDWEGAIAAYRRATELAPNVNRNWGYFASALASVGDCEAVDAIWTYSKLCRAMNDCELWARHFKKVAATLDCDKPMPTW